MLKNLRKSIYLISFFSLCFFSFNISSNCAVSIDNSNSFGDFVIITGPMSLSWSHTIGIGNDRYLVVTVSRHNSSISIPPSTSVDQTVTFTPNMMSPIQLEAVTSMGVLTGDLKSTVDIYTLLNPPSGMGTIDVSLAPLSEYAVGTSVSFFGVDQMNPRGTLFSQIGPNDTPTLTVTDSATGDIVMDALVAPFNSGFFINDMSQQVCFPDMMEVNCRRGRRFFPPGGGGTSDVGASSTEPALSPVTMSWLLASPGDWALAAIAVKAFSTTAANGYISGRVLKSNGRGIPRVSISISGINGIIKTVRTNPFGYFMFKNLEIGNTYILQPSSKSYIFNSKAVLLDDSATEINLYPIDR